MRCPRCGALSPEIADRCACGYDFSPVDSAAEVPYERVSELKEVNLMTFEEERETVIETPFQTPEPPQVDQFGVDMIPEPERDPLTPPGKTQGNDEGGSTVCGYPRQPVVLGAGPCGLETKAGMSQKQLGREP